MKRFSAKGEKLLKHVDLTLILPSGKRRHTRYTAGAQRGYSRADVDLILERVSDRLEADIPQLDFRLVALGNGRFNLIGEEKADAGTQGVGGDGRGSPPDRADAAGGGDIGLGSDPAVADQGPAPGAGEHAAGAVSAAD